VSSRKANTTAGRFDEARGKVAVVTAAAPVSGQPRRDDSRRKAPPSASWTYRLDAANEVVKEIRAAGGRAEPLEADVRDEDQVSRAIQSVAEQYSGLHVVFANAGINGMQCPIEEMTYDEFRATIDTNLTGTFLTVKHAIPRMREAGGGAIVITASVNGNRIWSLPGYSAYSSAKGGAGDVRTHGRRRAVTLEHPGQYDLPGRGAHEHRRAHLAPQRRVDSLGHQGARPLPATARAPCLA
jgi:NAD(P)-dependent dehydrogenase (short-subunit alcohol dehydrogenase family)